MFDFGFFELFVIIAAAIFLIGPNEIPGLLKSLGQLVRRTQYIKYAMSDQFDQFMKDNDLNEVRHYSVDPHADKKPLENVDVQAADEMLPLNKNWKTD